MYWFKDNAEQIYKNSNESERKTVSNVIKDKKFYKVWFIKENDKYYIIFRNQPNQFAKMVKFHYFGLSVTKEEGNKIYKSMTNISGKNGLIYRIFPNIDELFR